MREIQRLIDLVTRDAAKTDIISSLEALNQRLSYGLFWDEDHPENVETFDEEARGAYPILRTNPSLSRTAQSGRPTHLLIEGDNYHALSVLAYTHANSVDLVLIDPPYNTGEDFIYNDHRVINSDDPFKSTKWLSFMKKRLLLAKALLKPSGLIFVCIDDNEQATLKLLMDSIFPDKFVTTIHVEMSGTQGMKVKAAKNGNIVKNGEYILVYSMDGRRNVFNRALLNPSEYDFHYSLWLEENGNEFVESSLCYKLCAQPDIVRELQAAQLVSKDKQPSLPAKKLPAAYKLPLVRKFINEHRNSIYRDDNASGLSTIDVSKLRHGVVVKVDTGDKVYLLTKNGKGTVRQRICLGEKIGTADDYYRTFGPTTIRGDWWPGFYLDMGNVSKEGGVDFPNGKKPLRLFKQIIEATTPVDGTIVDFFAGSGTTLHAVSSLNASIPETSDRQAVIVTNNEANICREKTHPRCLNALDESAIGEGLAFYETAFIAKAKVSRDKVAREIGSRCLDILCVKTGTHPSADSYKLTKTWAAAWSQDKAVALVHGSPTDAELSELKALMTVTPVSWSVFAFSYDSTKPDSMIGAKLGVPTVAPVPAELTKIFRTAYGF